jgi:hypothetical protein
MCTYFVLTAIKMKPGKIIQVEIIQQNRVQGMFFLMRRLVCLVKYCARQEGLLNDKFVLFIGSYILFYRL